MTTRKKPFEKIVGRGENAGNQSLLFSANAFNLVKAKILRFDKAYSKNSCASGHPTLPRNLPPTLTLFSDATKKLGVSLCDPFSSKSSDELPKYHRNTPISWLFNSDF